MAQVNPVAGLGDRKQDMPVELVAPLDLPEQQDPGDGHQGHAQRIIQPGSLPQGRQADRPLDRENTLGIGPDAGQEADIADGEASEEQRNGPGQGLPPGQLSDELPEIKPQKEIAHEAAQVVEHAVRIPAGLAPEGILRRIRDAGRTVHHRRGTTRPLADERDDRREEPDSQIHQELLLPHFLRPRRQQRHDQVHAHEHVHEPQMAGGIVEVQQQILEILYGFAPDESVHDGPEEERDEDPRRPAAEELAG